MDADAVDAGVTATHVVAILADGREVATPLSWYPRLSVASAQKSRLEISPFSVHGPDIDEHLSVEGMLSASRADRR